MTVNINIDNETVFRAMAVIVGFVLTLWVIYITREPLILIGIAFFLSLALNPPVSYLAKRLPGHSRGAATATAYLVVLIALGLLIWLSVPPMVNQTNRFIQNYPEYAQELKTGDNLAADIVQRFDLESRIDDFQEQLDPDQLDIVSGPIVSFLQRISSSLISVLTVLVLSFFILVEGPRWLERFWSLQPEKNRDHRQALAQRMYKVVTGYVNGQLFIASIAGVSTLIMLVIMNAIGFSIPFALPLAATVAVLGLIPLIGATLGAVIVVVVALFSSTTAAIVMAIFFIIYQQIENNVLQPIVQSKSVNMSPLLILISAIIGVSVSGLLGAIVAIPIAASAKIVASDYLRRRDEREQTQDTEEGADVEHSEDDDEAEDER